MILNRLFCVLAMAFVLSSASADNRQHVVKPGDTLYSLSKRYGVTVEDIQAANPSIEGTNIPSGMTLVIPDENEVEQKEDKKKGKSIFFNFRKKDKKKDADKEEKVEQVKPEAPAVVEEKKEETPMERTRNRLKTILPGQSIGIMIGPEGGLEKAEVEQSMEAGFAPVTLGKRILRTETAGLCILSVLMFQLEE